MLIDPPSAVPQSVPHAPASGVVALAQPVSDAALFELVVTYLGAFGEAGEPFAGLLTDDAVGLDPGPHTARPQLLQEWQVRRRQLDYAQLRVREIASASRMDRFSFDDVDALSAPPRPAGMRPADVLVRVPLAAPVDSRSGEKLFRATLVLLVRPRGAQLLIAGVAEYDLR